VSDEGGFKARAGALTILLMLSVADRETTLAILAEIATGVRMEGLIELPDPDDELHMAIFEDDYMLEPVDPEEPIGPETKFRATEAGGEFLVVAGVLTSWLRQRPAGPLDLDEEAVQPVLALLGGWASGITHAFAAGPLGAGEAQERVGTLSLEDVEVRIGAMEAQGLLEALESEDGEVRYEATEWLRKGVAAIAAAARMELRYPAPGTAPIAVADVEAAFGLALPLLRLPGEASGACCLAVGLDPEVSERPAGVTAEVEAGRVVAVEPGLEQGADARAEAAAADWLDTVFEPDVERVRTSGDRTLAGRLVEGLRGGLLEMLRELQQRR
jgi:hypothetical protein